MAQKGTDIIGGKREKKNGEYEDRIRIKAQGRPVRKRINNEECSSNSTVTKRRVVSQTKETETSSL